MSADTAPAAMPGVEEMDRLCGALDTANTVREPQRCADLMDEARLAILAMRSAFAPILAEKEREIVELKGRLAVRMDYLVGLATTADRHVEAAAESRVLAAEAALAAERERCENAAFRALESMRDEGENDIRIAQSRVAAAIRAQGE